MIVANEGLEKAVCLNQVPGPMALQKNAVQTNSGENTERTSTPTDLLG